MRRRYTFQPTEQGRLRFYLAYLAFSGRGAPEAHARQSKEVHRSERNILTALKGVSEPHPKAEPIEPGYPDNRMRVLKSDGGVIELDQADFRRLQDYVESNQWASVLTDDAIDLEDSLDADAEKIEA